MHARSFWTGSGRGASLALQLLLLGGCADDSAGVEAGGDARDTEVAGGVEAEALPPELAAELLSDEPVPPPVALPAPREAAYDARAAYLRWLRTSPTVVVALVTVRELTPVR